MEEYLKPRHLFEANASDQLPSRQKPKLGRTIPYLRIASTTMSGSRAGRIALFSLICRLEAYLRQ